MSIRQVINKNKNAATMVVGLLVLGCGALIYFEIYPPRRVFHTDMAYYTDDDGATFFEDSLYKAPPFDHNGHQAVRAYVYTDGKGDFVGWMQRYKPDYKKQVDAALDQAQKDGKPSSSITSLVDETFTLTGSEVKKPGDANWVDDNSKAAVAVFSTKSRDGSQVDEKIP